VSMVKAFMEHKQVKANGNTSSHVQLCEYNDALMWGSQAAKQLLPRDYYEEVDKFLQSFRKETVDAKKRRKTRQARSGSYFKVSFQANFELGPAGYFKYFHMDIFYSPMELHGKNRQYW
jgi:hypothetical protein